ncbi:MAG: hypothetical protein NZU63_03305 [Gemmataceae bacterium]|nr:hypothetical protein [Gemmataceae bacterium]MDW8243883.1 hypothetical protein [Thermogemmata sp.]
MSEGCLARLIAPHRAIISPRTRFPGCRKIRFGMDLKRQGGAVNLKPWLLRCSGWPFGPFQLTQAIRPAPQVVLQPQQGYRLTRYEHGRQRWPVLSAAVSAERVFDVFLSLLVPLGDEVDVVVETSHGLPPGQCRGWRRQGIDRTVLISHLCDFEELLLHDGCTAIAVLCRRRRREVQFDEHKLLHVYAQRLGPFRRCLQRWGIPCRRHLTFICEADHWHQTQPHYAEQVHCLLYRLAAHPSPPPYAV